MEDVRLVTGARAGAFDECGRFRCRENLLAEKPHARLTESLPAFAKTAC